MKQYLGCWVFFQNKSKMGRCLVISVFSFTINSYWARRQTFFRMNCPQPGGVFFLVVHSLLLLSSKSTMLMLDLHFLSVSHHYGHLKGTGLIIKSDHDCSWLPEMLETEDGIQNRKNLDIC